MTTSLIILGALAVWTWILVRAVIAAGKFVGKVLTGWLMF